MLEVKIELKSGVIEVVSIPSGVRLLVRDYDVEEHGEEYIDAVFESDDVLAQRNADGRHPIG